MRLWWYEEMGSATPVRTCGTCDVVRHGVDRARSQQGILVKQRVWHICIRTHSDGDSNSNSNSDQGSKSRLHTSE